MKTIKNIRVLLAVLAVLAMISIPLGSQSYIANYRFLGSPLSVAASGTATDGTEFNSLEPRVSHNGYGAVCAITVTFVRDGAGTTDTVDFEFQASFDGGTSWSTAYYVRLRVATNETAISSTVIVTDPVNIYGISHLRLYRVVNNDSATNLTYCNAYVSLAVAN